MKTKLVKYLLMSLTLTGCSQDELLQPDNFVDSVSVTKTRSANLKAINNYLSKGKRVASRTTEDVLVPYIVDGDTVMFIANYGEGWEIFSNDVRIPMILMKSETGSFYPTTFNADSPFEQFFQLAAERLRALGKVEMLPSDTINNQWLAYGVMPLDDNWREPGGDGDDDRYEWVWVTSCPGEKRTIISTPKNGRLKTIWNQTTNFNQYTPYFKNKESVHSYVGCVPVAVGQFLYHTHQEFGVPVGTVTDAVYNESDKKYYFSGWSSEIWNSFSLSDSYYSEYMKPTALFLGYIGTKIGTKYGEKYEVDESGRDISDGSETGFSNAIPFIKDQTGLSSTVIDANERDCLSVLSKGYPVIMMANGVYQPDPKKNDTEDISHAFLVDYYKSVTEEYNAFYVYRKIGNDGDVDEDEWPEIPEDTTIEYLESIFGKGNAKVEIEYYEQSYFKCNWGDYGFYNDVQLSSNIPTTWKFGNYKYNSTFKMYKF